MRRCLAFILGCAAALVSPAAYAQRADYAELARQEARFAAIAWRLTTASAHWCPETRPQPGFILSDLRRFDPADRPAARLAYGATGDGAFVAGIAPGSPAARAGLKRGMVVAAINGRTPAVSDDMATIRIDVLLALIDGVDPAAALTITDETGVTHQMDAAPGCASAFRLELGGLPAAANGKLVRLRLSLAQSIEDDAELAAVIAHELAHNILRHRARLAEAGAARGAGSPPAHLVRLTELEADRLSVWLMADAGYDPTAAVRFWTRHKRPLIRAATHPPREQRIEAIEAELAAMQSARADDPAARPPLIDAPPPLE